MVAQDQRCRRHQNISAASVWYQLLCVALFWAWFRTRRIETSPHNLLHPLSITMRKYFNQKYFMQLPGWCWSWTWVRCWETWNSKSLLDVVECHQNMVSNIEIVIQLWNIDLHLFQLNDQRTKLGLSGDIERSCCEEFLLLPLLCCHCHG